MDCETLPDLTDEHTTNVLVEERKHALLEKIEQNCSSHESGISSDDDSGVCEREPTPVSESDNQTHLENITEPIPTPIKPKKTLSSKQLESLIKGREKLKEKREQKRKATIDAMVEEYITSKSKQFLKDRKKKNKKEVKITTPPKSDPYATQDSWYESESYPSDSWDDEERSDSEKENIPPSIINKQPFMKDTRSYAPSSFTNVKPIHRLIHDSVDFV